MDTSKIYMRMCQQAVEQTDIGEQWKQLPQMLRLGTFICFRSFIGMVVNVPERKEKVGGKFSDLVEVLPETLAWRNWCDGKTEDLKIISTGRNFNDAGFPLFRQDHIQEIMRFDIPNLGVICGYCCAEEMLYFARGKKCNLPIGVTPEQLWLAFYVWERHQKIWGGRKWVKKEGGKIEEKNSD